MKPRTKTNAKENRMCLDEIFNTADPSIKRYFAVAYYEEMELAEKRAIYRVANKFKHMLPESQQLIVTEAIRNMPTPVALAM